MFSGIIYLRISPSNKWYVGQTIDEAGRDWEFGNLNKRYGGAAIESNSISFGYDHTEPLYPYSPIADMQTASWVSQCCEVIGTIHDNPELLKQ